MTPMVKTLDIIVPVPAHVLPFGSKEFLGALIGLLQSNKTTPELRGAILLRRPNLLAAICWRLGFRILVKRISDRRRPTYKQILIQTNT